MVVSVLFIFILSSFASAVRFDVDQARQEEWDRFEAYKSDYVKFHDLESFSGAINEFNLARNFGFYGPGQYYISPDVWRAKYNPPLQGDTYFTSTRGYGSSLYNQPSAVKYFDGDYTRSNINGKYFDHPDAYGAYGYQTLGYQTLGNQRYGFNDYPYGSYAGNPAFYARIADNLGNGFYTVGFY